MTPAEIIRTWCSSCGMPEPTNGDCIALAAALGADWRESGEPRPADILAREREAFEAFVVDRKGKPALTWEQVHSSGLRYEEKPLPDHLKGRYFIHEEQAMWETWQARAAIHAQGEQS